MGTKEKVHRSRLALRGLESPACVQWWKNDVQQRFDDWRHEYQLHAARCSFCQCCYC